MASTYSTLKIELIGTGEQTGTWGTTTNDNFSVALGEAITGSADVAFSSSDVTVTLTDTNGAQTARNLRLNLTGTSGGARNLILGAGCQIEKLYLINNGLADAVTVKNTSGTGIAVPAGKSMFVYNDGTNVVEAVTASVTPFAVASGGTGLGTLTANNVLLGNGTSAVQFVAPGSNGNVLTSNGSTWASTTPATGTTFSAGTTGFTPNTATSGAVTLAGTLGVTNGGTGQTTYTNGQLLIGNTTGNTLTKATLTQGTGISITNGAGAITIAATGGYAGISAEVFNSSGTFTIPTGITKIKVTAAGGGGNGGNAGPDGNGKGGGGGAVAIQWLSGLTPGNTLSVTRGGAAGSSSVSSGTQPISTITGGGGGSGSPNDGPAGGGGSASGGAINIPGTAGNQGGGEAFMGPAGIYNGVGAGGAGNGTGGGGAGGGGPSGAGGAGAGGIVTIEY